MSIKAYATVRLTGCNIRRFINLCTANHIKIWNLKYVSPKEYEACCSTEDIFLMKPHLKKTHTKLLVVKRQGYFAIRAFLYKIRIITAAITGVFCIHALICKSSPNLCVNSSSSYISPSMLPLSSGDLIEWSLVCHSTLSYQKFCD